MRSVIIFFSVYKLWRLLLWYLLVLFLNLILLLSLRLCFSANPRSNSKYFPYSSLWVSFQTSACSHFPLWPAFCEGYLCPQVHFPSLSQLPLASGPPPLRLCSEGSGGGWGLPPPWLLLPQGHLRFPRGLSLATLVLSSLGHLFPQRPHRVWWLLSSRSPRSLAPVPSPCNSPDPDAHDIQNPSPCSPSLGLTLHFWPLPMPNARSHVYLSLSLNPICSKGWGFSVSHKTFPLDVLCLHFLSRGPFPYLDGLCPL